jgi:hypothetical protein
MSATATSYNPSYRNGPTSPVLVPLKAAVAVNVGDICFVDTSDGNTLKPAMSFPWTTNLATTQPLFVAQFAGIAGQQYDGVNANAYGIQDGNLRCDTSGIYDLACASATFKAGDLVGVAQDGANSNLAGQTVVNVATVGLAIGRVVQPYPNATTIVRVEIFAPFFNLVNAGAP